MRLASLIVLVLALVPAAAHAAPVLVAAGMAASTAAVVATAIEIGITVGMAIYGAAQQRRAEQAAKDAYNASLKDRAVTVVQADSPYRYVYGRARVGSAVVALFTTGDRDQYQHLVCVHAQHECDAIEEIYIAGKALGALDANGYVTSGDYYRTETRYAYEPSFGATHVARTQVLGNSGANQASISVVLPALSAEDSDTQLPFTYDPASNSVTFTDPGTGGTPAVSYNYTVNTSTVRVHKHLGTAGDPVDAFLHGLLPTDWPATATLSGHCYTVVTLDLNQAEFQGGIPSIEVLLRGKKLYDPRTGITAWSQCPPLAIYDYLRSEMCGVSASDIPVADVITAANVCDTVVAMASTAGSGPLYTLNGAVTSDEDQAQTLEKMAQSMAGGIVATTWSMWAGAYVAPVMSLYVDKSDGNGDVIGQIAITPGLPDADTYNGVKGTFIGAANSYVATDFPPYQNATYITADGGVEKWTNIDFPWTDDPQRVWNLARIFTEDQRNGYTVKADFSLKAWPLKIGDRVTLTSTLFGWNAKVFRVTDKQYSPASAVQLTLKEDASTIWDLVDAVTPDSTPNTNLPNPYAIAPLASITCTSGDDELLLQTDGTIVSRIHVTWPAATTQAVYTNGLIEIEWLKVSDNVWSKEQVSGSATDAYLSPVKDAFTYTIRARTVNPYFNTRSDWVYATHTVIGKTAAPPPFDTFVVLAQPDGTRQYNFAYTATKKPLDWLGAEIRYLSGSIANPDWDSMQPLQDNKTYYTSSPVEINAPLSGTFTFACKSLDTTGNESSYIVHSIDLPNRRLGNVFDEFYEKYDGWLGTLSGCHIQDGIIEADDTSTWSTIPATWGAWTLWSDSPVSPISYTTPIRDFGSIILAQVNAVVYPDGAYVLELATSNDNTTWSAWASAASPFTARYIKLRLTVSATASNPIPQIHDLTYTINAAIKSEYINDVDISTLTGAYRLGIGDIRIPLANTYSVIKRTTATIQDSRSGTWTYTRIDQSLSPAPRWQFRLDGALTDPQLVDFFVEGY